MDEEGKKEKDKEKEGDKNTHAKTERWGQGRRVK